MKSAQTKEPKVKQGVLSAFIDMSYHIITCMHLIAEIKAKARFWINIGIVNRATFSIKGRSCLLNFVIHGRLSVPGTVFLLGLISLNMIHKHLRGFFSSSPVSQV